MPEGHAITSLHKGSCHCGAVSFSIEMAPPSQAMVCNCSMCRRAGWMLAFRPAKGFTILAGEAMLHDYQFGKKSLRHQFCSRCGVRPFSRGPGHDGQEWVGINLRCVPSIDLSALEINSFDGASL